MKKQNKVLVYILNFLGLLSGVVALYFVMISPSTLYAGIGAGVAVVLIILSFVFQKPSDVMQTVDSEDDSIEDTTINEEDDTEIDDFEPESIDFYDEETIIEDDIIEKPITEEVMDEDEIDLDDGNSIHDDTDSGEVEIEPDQPVEIQPKPYPVSNRVQFKLDDDRFQNNIKRALELLDTSYLSIKNDTYTFRLEALLKLGIVDKKIWETTYEPFPFIGISKEADNLVVNVGVNRTEMIPVGYLPKSASSYLEDASKVALHAQSIGGSFHYISSSDHSFETYTEAPSVILTLTKKG